MICDTEGSSCAFYPCGRYTAVEKLLTVQSSLYGYTFEQLVTIANILKKEGLPPERVEEALTDVDRIVEVVRAEFEEELKKAIERQLKQHREGIKTMKENHKGHRALSLKPLEQRLQIVYIDTPGDIYKAINARCFDIATRQIGTESDRIYDIYCDDVGLLKPNYYIAAYGNHDCMLVGDILIARHDKYGEMVDLTNEDISYIQNHIVKWVNYDDRELNILFPISYPDYTR